MGLFSSFDDDAREAAEKIAAQFPGSSVTASVDGKVVTLNGHAADVETKGRIMQAFSQALPKAENIINNIRAEKPGHAASAPASVPVSAGSVLPGPEGFKPAAAAAATATAVADRIHEVKRGDTLSAIAREYYGNAGKYMKIYEANRDQLNDPDKIFPGQKLRIPD